MNQALQAIAAKYDVQPRRPPEFVSTGIPALDEVTGGVPKGRIVDIHGAEDAGKTALALALAKGPTLYIDAEGKLSPCMVPARDDFYVMRPESLEDALDVCRIAAKAFDTVVVDTIEALPARNEAHWPDSVDYKILDDQRDRLLSHALPILARECLAHGCTLILVNQMRNIPGVLYGRPDQSTGSRALRYYAALRLEINRVEYVKRRGEITGQKVAVWCSKNKYGPPGGKVALILDYSRGFLREERTKKEAGKCQ